MIGQSLGMALHKLLLVLLIAFGEFLYISMISCYVGGMGRKNSYDYSDVQLATSTVVLII